MNKHLRTIKTDEFNKRMLTDRSRLLKNIFLFSRNYSINNRHVF